MAWDHHKKPASGMPARGPSAWGNGHGAAKGAGTGKREAFEVGNTAGAEEKRTGGSTYRRMSKEERIGKLTEMAFDAAEGAEAENVRSDMIKYLMNREMGTPTAKQELSGPNGAPLQSISMTPEEFAKTARAIAEEV